jgi:formylglycine-generating enzyme required for sulfatase activity
MVAVPAPDGGKYCIDSTEVTQEQYAAFLADMAGDASVPMSPACSWNTTFQPADTYPTCYDPVGRAGRPIGCVDWCDAVGFCTWAGKHLCGLFPGATLTSNFPIWHEWVRACTAGGQFAYVYGDAAVRGRCQDVSHENGPVDDAGPRPVASLPGCQSPDPDYAGVYDLLGNVWEWQSACNPLGGPAGECELMGGAIGTEPVVCDPGPSNPSALFLPRDMVGPGVGFRCCAAQ